MTKSNSDYFKLLMETDRTSKLFARNLKSHLVKNRISCNVIQIILLHLINEANCMVGVTELVENVGEIITNCTYSLNSLASKGYILRAEGKTLGEDERCVFIDITKKGKELCQLIAKYTTKEVDKIRKDPNWTERNFDDYFCDLEILQHYFRNK